MAIYMREHIINVLMQVQFDATIFHLTYLDFVLEVLFQASEAIELRHIQLLKQRPNSKN